jgi:flagellar biosynthesis protein FlhF
MRVKRYIVDSMPEALDKIRADLGNDAVILNSKPIRIGGLFGMFGKMRIEVIAAVDEKASESPKPVVPSQDRQIDAPAQPLTGTYTAKQAYRRAASTQPAREQASSSAPEREAAKESAVAIAPIEVKDSSSKDHDALASELRDMRQMFQKLLMNDLSQQLPEALQHVRARLLEQEVSEGLTAEIIQKLMEQARPGHEWKAEEAIQRCREMIFGMLAENVQASVKLERNIRYSFFFGPTGVGKTTTIAKLAANTMLKEKKKIGFITADTYRMAAVEQLKTYANILNVPLEVVFSPKEMVSAMERLSDCDMIFVDTAGRNFRNDEYVQGISELVRHGAASTNYLVLSLTSKYNDMKAIINNFSDVPVKQVIYTKADETNSYGTMLNVSKETGLALSYITTGQNVPDDIVVATPEVVSTMIMGD